MRILRRLENPKMKRLALIAAAVVVVGGGYLKQKSGYKKEMAEQKTEYMQKCAKLEEKIKVLEIRLNPFRFSDYDEYGVKKSEIQAIMDAKMTSSEGDSFLKYKLPELKAGDVAKLTEKWKAEGRKFDRDYLQELDNKEAELLPRLQDSLDVYRDEDYLAKVAKYRQVVLEKGAILSLPHRHEQREVLKLFEMPSEKLAKEKREIFDQIRIKKISGAYKRYGWEFRSDTNHLNLTQNIIDVREFIRFNNAMVDDIQLSYRQLFESQKEPKIKKLREKPIVRENLWDKMRQIQWQFGGRNN